MRSMSLNLILMASAVCGSDGSGGGMFMMLFVGEFAREEFKDLVGERREIILSTENFRVRVLRLSQVLLILLASLGVRAGGE